MPLVRRIRDRGANIVVEAHGEVLFTPTGDVGRWTNRFSHRIRTFSEAYAPTNKRPRWAHYGKPLKSTFTSSTTYQPGRMRVYGAVGSSAPHAYYVDQGTGVYNGGGVYQGKILPPWAHGDGSLYEHTAAYPEVVSGTSGRSSVVWRKLGTTPIKGQKGQQFFDAGLRRAFQSMRMRSFQVPDDPKITNVIDSMPTGMANFRGNTVADQAFVAQLNEWRAWREAAWTAEKARRRRENRRERQPRVRTPFSEEMKRARQRKASQRYRDKKKSQAGKDTTKKSRNINKVKAAFLAAMVKKYGASNVEVDTMRLLRNKKGQAKWAVTVKVKNAQGKNTFIEVTSPVFQT